MLTYFKPFKPIILLDHQKEAVQWMTHIERFSGYYGGILADNMGLGKTFSIMGLIAGTQVVHREIPQLIIVPLAMVGTWVSTFADYGFPVYSISTSSSTRSSSGSQWTLKNSIVGSGKVPVYICHYHALISKPWLFQRYWFRIIVDEAHHIRNHKSKIYSCLSLLHSRYRWYVTATPIINSLKDLIAPLKWLGVIQGFKISLVELQDIYNSIVCGRGDIRGIMLKRTVKDIPLLRSSMPTFIREDKEVSMSSIESIIFMYLLEICDFSDRIRKILCGSQENIQDIKGVFELFQKDIESPRSELEDQCDERSESVSKSVSEDLDHIDSGSISALKGIHFLKLLSIDYRLLPSSIISQAIRSFNSSRGGSCREENEKGVPSKYVEVIKGIKGSSGSTIVFCQFNLEIKGLFDYFVSSGILGEDIYIINGAVSEDQRALVLAQMRERVSRGERVVLLLQLKSGACGLNLQYFTSVIFLSLWWNRSIIDQAIGRVVRIGGYGCKHVISFRFSLGYDRLISSVLASKEIS